MEVDLDAIYSGELETLLGKLVYLAGPMRGHPLHNFPAFFQASLRLRKAGVRVINPAEHDMAMGFDPSSKAEFNMRAALRRDLVDILDHADTVVVLDGWEGSEGAALEAHCAGVVKVPLLYWNSLEKHLRPLKGNRYARH